MREDHLIPVSMDSLSRESYVYEGVGTYYYDHTKPKWTWPFQKLACWILGRVGGHYRHVSSTVRSVRVDERDVLDMVRDVAGKAKHIYGVDPGYVFVGHDAYAKVVKEISPYSTPDSVAQSGPITFDMSRMGLRLTGGDETQRIFGMKLVLIPWMRGVLVVPKFIGAG